MREFWISSGHHLTQRTENGDLAITDALILAYLARPELLPPTNACAAEFSLHRSLLEAPRRHVEKEEVQAISDPDARENWQILLSFRQMLLEAPTIEAAYLDLVRKGSNGVPLLFVDQLVHLILRNALEGCDEPHVLRAGELFFRPQHAAFHEGNLLLADAEIIEQIEQEQKNSPLAAMLGGSSMLGLDVLEDSNAWTYWSRSDAFTMVLNLGFDQRGGHGLARAIETWIRHLLHVEVVVEPIGAIRNNDWRWFVGLDAEGTKIGNRLWAGQTVDQDALSRLIALFRLHFMDKECIDPRMIAHPVYLFLAMTCDNIVRMKPQNLIVGLPLREKPGLI
jgi:hypothetical protein